jgi:hypothetical protein
MDPVNNLGFSPLMKAALQGRIKCSKLLLFSGMLQCTHVLGAVYTCDFPYKSPYDSVYDLLPKVSSKLIFDFCFAHMCKQTITMGNRKIIGSLFCLRTNRARNRMAIRTQIRTRVDGP